MGRGCDGAVRRYGVRRTIEAGLSDRDYRTGTLAPSGPTLAPPPHRPLGPYVMRSRIYQPEIMDEETLDQDTVDEIYRYLASVNHYLGGVNATIARFEAFSRTWRAGERIEVLEIACGAADVPKALITWGRSRGFDLRVTATDILTSALDYARRVPPVDERLRLVACKLFLSLNHMGPPRRAAHHREN